MLLCATQQSTARRYAASHDSTVPHQLFKDSGSCCSTSDQTLSLTLHHATLHAKLLVSDPMTVLASAQHMTRHLYTQTVSAALAGTVSLSTYGQMRVHSAAKAMCRYSQRRGCSVAQHTPHGGPVQEGTRIRRLDLQSSMCSHGGRCRLSRAVAQAAVLVDGSQGQRVHALRVDIDGHRVRQAGLVLQHNGAQLEQHPLTEVGCGSPRRIVQLSNGTLRCPADRCVGTVCAGKPYTNTLHAFKIKMCPCSQPVRVSATDFL